MLRSKIANAMETLVCLQPLTDPTPPVESTQVLRVCLSAKEADQLGAGLISGPEKSTNIHGVMKQFPKVSSRNGFETLWAAAHFHTLAVA